MFKKNVENDYSPSGGNIVSDNVINEERNLCKLSAPKSVIIAPKSAERKRLNVLTFSTYPFTKLHRDYSGLSENPYRD